MSTQRVLILTEDQIHISFERDSLRGMSNSTSKEIAKRTQIFGMEFLTQISFLISNSGGVTSRNDYIIHIYNQDNGILMEEWCKKIKLAMLEC